MLSTEWDFEFNTQGAGERILLPVSCRYSLCNERCLFLFCFKFGFSKDKSWIDQVIILAC